MNAPTTSTPSSNIESMLVENRVFPPTPEAVKAARISGMEAYNAMCREADTDFEGFWARLARSNLSWSKPFTEVLDESNPPFYKWFADGELNASYTCHATLAATVTAFSAILNGLCMLLLVLLRTAFSPVESMNAGTAYDANKQGTL